MNEQSTHRFGASVDAPNEHAIGRGGVTTPATDVVLAEVNLSTRQTMVRSIGNRLFILLIVFLLGMGAWSAYVFIQIRTIQSTGGDVANLTIGAFLPVVFAGVLGGIISLQKRLNTLSVEDLLLLRKSLPYLLLAPLVGGFLATLLYTLFLAGLLQGDLFPQFMADPNMETRLYGMASIFMVHGETYQDYGKLFFWCFVAGYSERFVTNIIGQFEGAGTQANQRAQDASAEQGVDKR